MIYASKAPVHSSAYALSVILLQNEKKKWCYSVDSVLHYFCGWKQVLIPFNSKTTIIITFEIKRKY